MARLSFGSLLLFGLPMWGVNLSRNSFACASGKSSTKESTSFWLKPPAKITPDRSLSLPIDFSISCENDK